MFSRQDDKYGMFSKRNLCFRLQEALGNFGQGLKIKDEQYLKISSYSLHSISDILFILISMFVCVRSTLYSGT